MQKKIREVYFLMMNIKYKTIEVGISRKQKTKIHFFSQNEVNIDISTHKNLFEPTKAKIKNDEPSAPREYNFSSE